MKSSIRMFLLVSTVASLFCCVGMWFYPIIGLRFNLSLWLANQPTEYQMQIEELRPDSEPWRWIIRVKDGSVISNFLLESDTHTQSKNESWLDPIDLTIEQVFVIAQQQCVQRGFLDCGIEYDSEYHFPKLVNSYDLIIVRIENFIDCSKTPADCADY